MNEIQPVLPSQSVRKPVKVTPEKDQKQRKSNPSPKDASDEQDSSAPSEDSWHIDETV